MYKLAVVLAFLTTIAGAAGAAGADQPVTVAGTGQTRTLADVARERKLGVKGAKGGTLSVAGTSTEAAVSAEAGTVADYDKARYDASDKMRAAIERGTWVRENIHHNGQIIEQAKRDWDAAAEACRKTPGCTPLYRPGSR